MPIKTFKLRPKAEDDLVKIYQYSVQEWGDVRAEEYLRDINSSFMLLVTNPMLGRDCNYIRPTLRALNVESHVIFYKPTTYGVAIIRVLFKAMDYQRHF